MNPINLRVGIDPEVIRENVRAALNAFARNAARTFTPETSTMSDTTSILRSIIDWIDARQHGPQPGGAGTERHEIRDHIWSIYNDSTIADRATMFTDPEPPAPLIFRVSPDYRYDAACNAITKIIEYLDPDSIRGGILIIPSFKDPT